jgi:uncharacterized membrane protein YkvA (DUF1232 family)
MRQLLIALAVAAVLWLVAIAILMIAGRRSAARELAQLVPNLVSLFRGLLGDPRVPWGTKVWIVLAIAWVASPIDLIPEFLPIVGPLDDAIVAALVLRHVVKVSDPSIVMDHWKGDPEILRRITGRSVTDQAMGG